MIKRLLSFTFAIVLVFCAVPAFNVNSSASVVGYNVDNSLRYAKKNWNNGVGLCAEYASRCLSAGNVDVFETQVEPLYNTLKSSYGKAYKLTLTGGTRGRVSMQANKGKLKKGDPIFYKCNYCGDFEHVVICNGANSSGYSQDYAHNKAHNGNKTTYTYRHCGGDSWTLYSVNMYETEKLFGAKSSVTAPKITSTSNGCNGIVIKWGAIEGADKYRVYRKIGTGSWKKIGETKKAYYTDRKGIDGTEYTYTVRAVDDKSVSQYYAGKKVTCIGIPNLGTAVINPKYIKINWRTVPSADGYNIYRKNPGGNWKKIKTLKGNSKSAYTDYTAQPGVEYIYTVRAYCGKVSGGYNNNGLKAVILDAPLELTAVSEENTGITVSYPQIPCATGYRIYRKTAEGKWLRICDIVGGDITSYTDTDVELGKSYTYTVRAKNGSILSRYNTKGVTCTYEEIEETTSPETSSPEVTQPETTTETAVAQ